MFNFMKKNNTPKSETPQQQAERDTAVDKVLLGYHVGHSSIATMVTGLDRQSDELTLDLRLPNNSHPKRAWIIVKTAWYPDDTYECATVCSS